jgi:hypothetical protein
MPYIIFTHDALVSRCIRSNPEFEIDATSREYALLHPR